jgi:hypothetical protein
MSPSKLDAVTPHVFADPALSKHARAKSVSA